MFFDLIQKRRSIRRYQKKMIEKEKVDFLVEAALRAPSSRGFNPWEFVVVTDSGLLEKLSCAKPHGASFLKNAPLGIVVCGNPEKSDVWVEDASIASIFLHLAATELGLGSCWIQIRKRDYRENRSSESYIADLLGLSENLSVESIVAIGYPLEQKTPHEYGSLEFDKISYNYYKNVSR